MSPGDENNASMEEDNPAAAGENDEDYDGPVFLNPEDAEEVDVDDDVPMEDDEDEAGDMFPTHDEDTAAIAVPDMSRVQLASHTGPIYAVAAHLLTTNEPSVGLMVVSGGGDDKAFLHSVKVGSPGTTTPEMGSTKLLDHAHTDSVSCVAFNFDFITEDLTKTPRMAAVAAFDGTCVLYDPDTGTKLHTFDAGPSDVEWMCFHPKGGTVLLAGSSNDCTIWMYHLLLKRCLQVFVGHEKAVTCGAFSPDGKWALSGSADGTVRVWAPKTGLCKHAFRFGGASSSSGEQPGLTCMAINGGSDGQLIIVGTEDGLAYVCHIGTKKVVATLRHFDIPPQQLTNNLRSEDDEEEELDLPTSVEAVGFASATVNPNWCATGGVDGTLKIFDLTMSGQCRQVCKLPSLDGSMDSAGGITRLTWHPTLPLVFTSSTNGALHLWDARNGGLLHTLTGHTDTINDMDIKFIDDGKRAVCVTGGDDQKVRVFDVDVMAVLQAATVAV